MSDKEGNYEVKNDKGDIVATGSVWAGPKDMLHVAVNLGVEAAKLYGLPPEKVTAFVPKGKRVFVAQLRKRPKEGQLPYKAVDGAA